MATLGMTELATIDLTRSDALHSNQVMRQPAVTRNTPSENNRVRTDVRVLNVLVVDAEQASANKSATHRQSSGSLLLARHFLKTAVFLLNPKLGLKRRKTNVHDDGLAKRASW
jgi:hypothetical protein